MTTSGLLVAQAQTSERAFLDFGLDLKMDVCDLRLDFSRPRRRSDSFASACVWHLNLGEAQPCFIAGEISPRRRSGVPKVFAFACEVFESSCDCHGQV